MHPHFVRGIRQRALRVQSIDGVVAFDHLGPQRAQTKQPRISVQRLASRIRILMTDLPLPFREELNDEGDE